jgi:hypothetical protein
MLGNLIYGIFMRDGLEASVYGFMPPLARGTSGITIGCCLNIFYATTGALKVSEGMLLIPLGLFSASNL